MEESPLLHTPSNDDQIIKALKGFSIVENVITIENTIVILVDNEQWVTLDEVQKKLFSKIVQEFINANVTVKDIYIKNNQGEILENLQNEVTGNNYMVKTNRETEKSEAEKEQGSPFDLEKALSTEDTQLQNTAAVSTASGEKSAREHMQQHDSMDRAFRELAIEPVLQPAAHKKSKYRVLYKIVIVFVVVIIANAAGYYFSFKQQEQAKQSFELFKKAAPARGPQTQTDKKSHVIKPTVQDRKTADNNGIDPGRMESSQTAVPPTDKKGTAFPATKETKTAEPAPAGALIEAKPVHPTLEEKKVNASFQQEVTFNGTMYCVNVALCKFKESADVVIKDLQRKGYEPAGDTITANGTTWYRVTLGNFQTQREAQNHANELKRKKNINGFVVKKKK